MVEYLGNPNWPCLAGGEIQPVASATVPVDQGTRYDFAHTVRASAVGSITGRMTAAFVESRDRQQHVVAFELWAAGDETVTTDTITTVVLPLRRVDKGATAVINGGGTALAAISARGGAYIGMDATLATSWVKAWFDPALLTAGGVVSDWPRVIRVGLRWLAWKNDSSNAAIPVGEGFGVELVDTVLADNKQYGSWLVPDYQRAANTVVRWLGETNHLPRDVTNPWRLMPFTVTDLSHMAAADESLFIQIYGRTGPDSSQTTTFLDFLEMVVEVAPERREGVANRLITNQTTVIDLGYTSPHIVEWRDPTDPQAVIALTGGPHVATIREALPASPSDRYRAATSGAYSWSYPEAIGPSLALMGITQARATQAPQLETRIGTISGGVLAGPPVPFEDFNLAAAAYDEATRVADHPFWAAYPELLTNAAIRLTYLADIVQTFTADGVTAYTRVQVMCRPDPLTTEALTVSLKQPIGTPLRSVSIPAATVAALPDVGGGWRIATAVFSSPVVPAAGTAYVTARLLTVEAVWFVAGADLLGTTLYTNTGDHAMLVVCEPTVPDAPTVTSSSTELTAGAGCGVTSVSHLDLSWTVDADAAVYGVLRSIDAGVTWTTIAYLQAADAVGGVLTYADLGAPWDVPVVYWLIAYRASDLMATPGPASTPVTIASGGAVLGLASATSTMIYAPTSESGSVTMPWTDLNPVEYVPLAGQDGQRAMRAPEDRGLGLTVSVLIAELAVCADAVPIVLPVASRAMDPAPWDLIRILARENRLTVRFPGGATRVMSLALTGLVARTEAGVYMADLVLTDVHTELDNPLPGL